MKKYLLVFSILISISSTIWSAWTANALTWFGYGLTIKTNDIIGGAFYLERARIELRGDILKDLWGNVISGRFSGDLQTTPIVRYTYFDYKIMNEFIISVGILPFYFGNIVCNWGYSPVLPDVSERFAAFRPVPNTDYGLMISGNFIPQMSVEEKLVDVIKTNTSETGDQIIQKEVVTTYNTNKWSLLSYYTGIMNGEGFRETFNPYSFSTNILNYAYFGTISINPVFGLSIIFSGKYQPYSSSNNGIFRLKDEITLGGVISAKKPLNIPIEFLFEYIYEARTLSLLAGATPIQGYILGTYIGYGLFNGIFTPFIRFDMCDNNSAVTTGDYQVLDIGYIFKPTKANWELHGTVGYWLTKDGASSGDIDVLIKFVYQISANIKD